MTITLSDCFAKLFIRYFPHQTRLESEAETAKFGFRRIGSKTMTSYGDTSMEDDTRQFPT